MPTPLQKSSKMSKACRVNKVHRVFSLTDMKYLKDGKRMPIYLQKHVDMKETFNACTGSVNDRMICQKLTLRVKENTAFILDQNTCLFSSHPTFRLAMLAAASNVATR